MATMCGIAGAYLYKTGRSVDRARLGVMAERLRHRGPDDGGFLVEGPLGLASRRLSIIDLETGRQPIAGEQEKVWTVFNGEIYNYVELREELARKGHRFTTRSDTEVLVHLYEEEGDSFVERLNGMFAAAIWDRARRRLLLVRDRAGIKPLFYAEVPDGLIFASEMRALLAAGVPADLDRPALAEYLASGYTISPATGLSAVRKLAPGELLACDGERVSVRRYWTWPAPAREFPEKGAAREEFRTVLRGVLRRQLRSDVPVGLFLSGGTDSRLLAAFLARDLGQAVPAVSMGFEDRGFDETEIARRSAERLGLDWTCVRSRTRDLLDEVPRVLESGDDPLMDQSAIPTHSLCRWARGRFKTVLAGDGGDELFGGYPTYALAGPAEIWRQVPGWARRGLRLAARRLGARQGYLTWDEKLVRFLGAAGEPPGGAHPRYKALLGEEEQGTIWVDPVPGNPFRRFEEAYDEARSLGVSGVARLLFVDFKTFLPESCLTKVDRMSMAHGLEVRVPLLDNEIVDFAARLPARWKVRSWTLKAFLKEELARFLPRNLVFWPKHGFVPPMARWLNGPLRAMVADLLSEARVRRQGLFRPEAIRRLLEAHASRRGEHSRAIWALAVLSVWLDRSRAEPV